MLYRTRKRTIEVVMWIETKKVLIPLSEAKLRFNNGQTVYFHGKKNITDPPYRTMYIPVESENGLRYERK